MCAIPSPEGIDRLIHERARLGIMSSLAGTGAMTFGELKETLVMTDGNLSAHARVLEEAGYIRIVKTFAGRKPQTTMSLTAKGEKAFKEYVDYLERMVLPRKNARATER